MKKTPGLVLLVFAVAQPAFARDRDDDDRDREHGRDRDRDRDGDRESHTPRSKFENNEHHYKYEYRDRNCRYKYEYNYKNGKTKVDQKGDCTGVVLARAAVRGEPLPRAIPPEPQARTIECNREVLGAIIGGAIGRSMDEADQACAAQALEYANLKQTIAWKNPARSASYTITPTEVVRSDKGTECRKYVMRTVAGGQQQDHAGSVCRQANGSWALVN